MKHFTAATCNSSYTGRSTNWSTSYSINISCSSTSGCKPSSNASRSKGCHCDTNKTVFFVADVAVIAVLDVIVCIQSQ